MKVFKMMFSYTEPSFALEKTEVTKCPSPPC